MTDELFLQEVKRYVQEIDPQAEVWLFGSRARGDARADSDWDFLVLTDKPADKKLKSQLRGYLYEVELASGKVIGSIVHSKQEWKENYQVTPLYRNIKREGKSI